MKVETRQVSKYKLVEDVHGYLCLGCKTEEIALTLTLAERSF